MPLRRAARSTASRNCRDRKFDNTEAKTLAVRTQPRLLGTKVQVLQNNRATRGADACATTSLAALQTECESTRQRNPAPTDDVTVPRDVTNGDMSGVQVDADGAPGRIREDIALRLLHRDRELHLAPGQQLRAPRDRVPELHRQVEDEQLHRREPQNRRE